MDWAVIPAAPSCPESAMLKHPACAAAISSSGLVPGCVSKRLLNEYGVFLRTPLAELSVPLPSFSPPLQCALAFRCIGRITPKLRYRTCILIRAGERHIDAIRNFKNRSIFRRRIRDCNHAADSGNQDSHAGARQPGGFAASPVAIVCWVSDELYVHWHHVDQPSPHVYAH